MNAIEREASEVLALVRFLKNSFAPVNKISPVVLSLIPDYLDEVDKYQDLIALTHVCRIWRDVFISRASLWTHLDLMHVDQTRVYIQRSKSSPLEILIGGDPPFQFSDDALSLVMPHLHHRLKSLTIMGGDIPSISKQFHFHSPLLEELKICVGPSEEPTLDRELFNGALSTLRSLSLDRVVTDLPWKNLANLEFLSIGSEILGYNMTQLLNLFEAAPLLRTIRLGHSIPESSDAPLQRMVPLLHLNTLHINADSAHSTVLNHLSIPTGASLTHVFHYRGNGSPLLHCLPESSPNLLNLSHITAINLCFNLTHKLRLTGPSGGLRMFANCSNGQISSYDRDCQILRSIRVRILSTTRRLSFSKYEHYNAADAGGCPVLQSLSLTNSLRTLVLSQCNNLPFIFALDPAKNPFETLLCPDLEEFVLYIRAREQFHTKHLINMAKNRASRGVKLSSVTVIGLGELAPRTEVFRLRDYVTHVEYRLDDASPAWDDLPVGWR